MGLAVALRLMALKLQGELDPLGKVKTMSSQKKKQKKTIDLSVHLFDEIDLEVTRGVIRQSQLDYLSGTQGVGVAVESDYIDRSHCGESHSANFM